MLDDEEYLDPEKTKLLKSIFTRGRKQPMLISLVPYGSYFGIVGPMMLILALN